MKKIFILLMTCFLITTANASLEEIFGNGGNGDQCQSDYQCGSLCCDQTKGVCNPHDPSAKKPIFCSKVAGQQCLTSEFCKSEYVQTCKLVKIGISPVTGKVNCTLRCLAIETRGSCVNGFCEVPKIPPVPPFDPANPDCSSVVDP